MYEFLSKFSIIEGCLLLVSWVFLKWFPFFKEGDEAPECSNLSELASSKEVKQESFE